MGFKPSAKQIYEAVMKLDALSVDDPESAHAAADEILLAASAPDVREAYARLVERSPWWATA